MSFASFVISLFSVLVVGGMWRICQDEAIQLFQIRYFWIACISDHKDCVLFRNSHSMSPVASGCRHDSLLTCGISQEKGVGGGIRFDLSLASPCDLIDRVWLP